ncbi:MAG: Lrp/AsnC family transcriptional regulator [Eubacterium sp.]|nr:Lrp/AsnC family transcriptional regulator [Eubacterium sp.]
MDEKDIDILRLLRDNGRVSLTEIGKEIGMSRVAVKKRVKKLEDDGIIRGYTAIIFREDNVKMLMEITMVDDDYEDILEYLNRTGYVTEIYIMTGKNRIHATAVAPDVSELKYLARMVSKTFADKIKTLGCHGVKEIVKDTLGGITYDRESRTGLKDGN